MFEFPIFLIAIFANFFFTHHVGLLAPPNAVLEPKLFPPRYLINRTYNTACVWLLFIIAKPSHSTPRNIHILYRAQAHQSILKKIQTNHTYHRPAQPQAITLEPQEQRHLSRNLVTCQSIRQHDPHIITMETEPQKLEPTEIYASEVSHVPCT